MKISEFQTEDLEVSRNESLNNLSNIDFLKNIDEDYTANMYQMFVNLPAEVITQGVSMIHTEFTKFFCFFCVFFLFIFIVVSYYF